jgi:hypothetical protein
MKRCEKRRNITIGVKLSPKGVKSIKFIKKFYDTH